MKSIVIISIPAALSRVRVATAFVQYVFNVVRFFNNKQTYQHPSHY